jgi:NDP-sugar pyrophosphorylase family protein
MPDREPLPEAVFLVGGLGTRLRPLVRDRPKALALVAGKPYLEWMIEIVRAQGVERVILCTGYLGRQIEDHFGAGDRWDLEIRYSREEESLGTGGAVAKALPMIRGPHFFVLNGDSFCDFDLRRMLDMHRLHGAAATMWLVPVDDCSRYGEVVLDPEGKVVQFREKSGTARPGLVNAGVYVLDRRAVEEMAPPRPVFSLEKDLFAGLAGSKMAGIRGQGPFLDIGTPESYKLVDLFVKTLGK